MAKACIKPHQWLLMNMGAKTYVMCAVCAERFAFTAEFNGAIYKGKVPARYDQTGNL